ncbi:MAG: glycogen synthase GlgA [Gammaproteobacteria bacterium]|nr:glycogen synthase GlgA [Gammaproteobacteria bacterium]
MKKPTTAKPATKSVKKTAEQTQKNSSDTEAKKQPTKTADKGPGSAVKAATKNTPETSTEKAASPKTTGRAKQAKSSHKEESKPTQTGTKRPSSADAGQTELTSSAIRQNKTEQSTQPKQTALDQTSSTAGTTSKGKPVYQEPEQPYTSAPAPVVEKAEPIEPPIPDTSGDMEPSEELATEPQHSDHAQYQPPGPQYQPKFVVQITPEMAPLAKVGGLADVVTGLSRELEIRGNTVEIILPKYDCMRYENIWGLCVTFEDLWVPWYGGHIHCTVWFGFVHDRKCFFIEPHSPDNFFSRGAIYGFDDDILRFAFFSRAALEFMLKSGKHPDVIHCHDWQTALVPVFLYEIYQHIGMNKPRVCFTIHNYKHQGVTGDFLLDATGLYRPEYYFHPDRLLDNNIPHALNLMKGGIVYSNFITTVSPRYAGETKDGGQGFGLEPTLHRHHYKYGGVVNGIDYDTWNPDIDAHIPVQYTVDSIDNKYANKHALRDRLLLAESNKPIIAFIGRLDPQKGLDLVRHTLFYALNNDAQFILLGSSPDESINHYFWELKRHLNDSPDCHIEVGFDENLAHLIYAGSDMMIVPSLFEPCGLTQLIAMKYGTIPVVRSVGGLADTVHDKDFAHDKPLHERNGYVFNNYDNAGIESALSRAISCYYQYPEHFRDLIVNAMHSDYSWRLPGQHYLNIYDYIAG